MPTKLKSAEEWFQENNHIGTEYDVSIELVPLFKQIQLNALEAAVEIAQPLHGKFQDKDCRCDYCCARENVRNTLLTQIEELKKK